MRKTHRPAPSKIAAQAHILSATPKRLSSSWSAMQVTHERPNHPRKRNNTSYCVVVGAHPPATASHAIPYSAPPRPSSPQTQNNKVWKNLSGQDGRCSWSRHACKLWSQPRAMIYLKMILSIYWGKEL